MARGRIFHRLTNLIKLIDGNIAEILENLKQLKKMIWKPVWLLPMPHLIDAVASLSDTHIHTHIHTLKAATTVKQFNAIQDMNWN